MFSKETEYALRALVYIQSQNNSGRRPGLAEIAVEIEAPHFFTAKILQRLVKAGAVNSLKGKGGGFSFDNTKPDITIRQVVDLTGGSKVINGCGFGLKHCDEYNPCPLHLKYAPIRDAINLLITTETIQSLASKISAEANQLLASGSAMITLRSADSKTKTESARPVKPVPDSGKP
jgi:Rrf2 family protein